MTALTPTEADRLAAWLENDMPPLSADVLQEAAAVIRRFPVVVAERDKLTAEFTACYSSLVSADEERDRLRASLASVAGAVDAAQQMLGRWNEWYGHHGGNLALPPAGIVKTLDALAEARSLLGV
jgi:hypothetical protein